MSAGTSKRLFKASWLTREPGREGDVSGDGAERFRVKNYDDKDFAGQYEVADSRTPLTALLEGEPEEKSASEAVVDQAARRVADRILEEVDVDEEWLVSLLRSAMADEILEVRLNTIRTVLRYIWQDAKNPWDAMKNVLAVTRLAASHLIRGASQVAVAFILRETKGATRAREKRKVEELLKEWGVQGFHLEGGQKSESARATYAEVQRGNRNRAKDKNPNKKRKRAA